MFIILLGHSGGSDVKDGNISYYLKLYLVFIKVANTLRNGRKKRKLQPEFCDQIIL
jgi:hypothetical protein